jgi:hypothetical protein
MITEASFNFIKSIFLFFLAVFIACKEPKKNFVYKKPSYDSIRKMSYEKAVQFYGKPFAENGVFNLQEDGLVGPRITLLRTYKSYENYPDIKVLEAIWRKDSIIDIMVWYKKEKNKWEPIDTIMYEHGTDF